MKKKAIKILSVVLVLVMTLSSGIITANAGDYPSVFFWGSDDFDNADDLIVSDTAEIGDYVLIRMKWYAEFTNEGYDMAIYDSNGSIVATAEKRFTNFDYVRTFTVGWDTTGLDEGEYTVRVKKLFYSYYQWNEAPTVSTLYITLSDHKYKIISKTPATIDKNGKIVKKCSICGKKTSTTIYCPKKISLSTTSYTYNGKVKKPSVTVKDAKGKTLKKGTDYTVSYAKGRKNVGKYSVKITFKGLYKGTKTLYFTIKPKATSISKLTAGSKKFTVKWYKRSTQVTGYQVQYATNNKFKNAKTVIVSKNSTTSKTVSKLSAKKKYYVRVRTYKTVNGTKYYSDWSKTNTVTTK